MPCSLCRYEHYGIDGDGTSNGQTRRQKSDDPFSDKYFDIMDRVQALNLVSSLSPPGVDIIQSKFHSHR